MASTFSTNLALELIGTGDQAGSWGNTTNTNLGTLIEQAVSGYVTQAVATGTDTTITIPDGATGVARNMYIELTGTGGTNTNLLVPANKKLYFVYNNTTGAVTVKVSGQTGVSVNVGEKKILVSNGTDIVEATTYLQGVGSSISVSNLTATSATITTLTGTSANITTLTGTTFGTTATTNLRGLSAQITTLTTTSADITTLTGTTFGTTATTNLRGLSAQITTLTVTSANITTLTGTTFGTTATTQIGAASATITNLNSTSANITTLTGTTFGTTATTQLRGASAQITTLTATSSNITTLSGTTATYTSANITTLGSSRVNPRVSATTSSNSLTPDISAYDEYAFTALAAALTINAPIGTPVDGNKLIIRLLDNGTSRALTWNGTYTVIGVTLPTSTTISKTTYVGCIYNAGATRWDVVAVTTQA